jgi:hypothetical protein
MFAEFAHEATKAEDCAFNCVNKYQLKARYTIWSHY